VLAVVTAAGGEARNIARMTVYVTDLDAYRAGTRAIGQAWRSRMGRHFPAMALLGVAGLVEKRAKVEIEATCILPSEVTK
jgi:enamine deaminase RidA (YjgF/YER057c/UK114 family)